MTIDALEILRRHHADCPERHELLIAHSSLVTAKALDLARAYVERHPDVELDLVFIEEAGLLHDIGIGACDAVDLHCRGDEPYVRHGLIGRAILEREGLPKHALVCERHTGAGMTREEVLENGLPLPDRDYMPISLEEKIICVADKFYSKSPGKIWRTKSLAKIRRGLEKWGVLERWDALWREVVDD